MAAHVSIHFAESHLAQLLARVEAGEEIIIARGVTPVARLAPVPNPPTSRLPGRLRGLVDVGEDILEPLDEEELTAWEGDAGP